MYEVHYSGRVIELLREMILRNPAHALRIISAIQEIDRRLRIYPQFGQPLKDLAIERAQLWIGVVSPLIVQYVLVEADDSGQGRQVIVVRPIISFPHTGIV
jgi:hypothetical protein